MDHVLLSDVLRQIKVVVDEGPLSSAPVERQRIKGT
jgi:hypothetical protein